MTHHEEVLDRALDNLISRIERGQELPNAIQAVNWLYGVRSEELESAYETFCGAPETNHES